MAIQLKGTLNTVFGATSESYLRIEYVKFKPWEGTIEYNPILYKTPLDAEMSRIQFYGDIPPERTFPCPFISMSFVSGSAEESGSIDTEITFDDIIQIPLSGALQEVTVNHYSNIVHSMSVEVTDFDEDGNEIITEDLMYWNEYGIGSQSLETRNPVDLSRTGSLLEQCYDHFKVILAEQIPAENILDI
tara:strand:+ start:419 stop:985 length:567 start_codon:yes stop_codon:yes gene_type:complete